MVDLIHNYIYSVEWLKVIPITIIKMTDGKLCTMNLNHLMNTISIYVNSDCIECRRHSKHEHHKKKTKTTKIDIKSIVQSLFREMQIIFKKKLKKKFLIHTFPKKNYTKVFHSRVNLISLRPDMDFGHHPNRTHFTDLIYLKMK